LWSIWKGETKKKKMGGSRSRRCSSSILKSQWADQDRERFDLGVKIEKGKIEKEAEPEKERYRRDLDVDAPPATMPLPAVPQPPLHPGPELLACTPPRPCITCRHALSHHCLHVPSAASSCCHAIYGNQWRWRLGQGRRYGGGVVEIDRWWWGRCGVERLLLYTHFILKGWSRQFDSSNGSGRRRGGNECLIIVLRLPWLEDLGRMGIDTEVCS
jgi:hypothetical protein